MRARLIGLEMGCSCRIVDRVNMRRGDQVNDQGSEARNDQSIYLKHAGPDLCFGMFRRDSFAFSRVHIDLFRVWPASDLLPPADSPNIIDIEHRTSRSTNHTHQPLSTQDNYITKFSPSKCSPDPPSNPPPSDPSPPRPVPSAKSPSSALAVGSDSPCLSCSRPTPSSPG